MIKEKKEAIQAESGKFLIDIAKLVFGGVILVGIMKHENINPYMLFGIGIVVVLLFFVTGLLFISLSKHKKE